MVGTAVKTNMSMVVAGVVVKAADRIGEATGNVAEGCLVLC